MPDPYQAWAKQLLQVVLTSWRERADSPDGLFNPYLDRQWRHTSDGPRTLVSQCRLIYNFARAFELGGDPGYADFVQRGIAALERNFGDPDGDGWVWACHGDGRLADDTGDAYGHAFVILALATAAAGLGEARHRDLALRTWDAVQRRFRDRHGGLLWHVDRAGRALDDARSQNPLMHTFEALLVLATLDGAGAARQDAREIWAFLRSRMLGPGILPEWYTPDWQPVASGPRSIVDVGHAFEWAFLLSEAQELFPDDDLLGPGRDFLAFGLRHGYDAAEGGIVSPVDFAGRPRDGRKGWWEQCEAIRAMRRYVVRHGAAEAEIPLARSIDFAQRHFVDEEFGGWYEGPFGAGATPSFEKGNAWKLDYHVVNMCRELAAGEG
jgi:mannose/cellobiose epimerase-like protein (N-acyl-D-glucosamine 2-epimerase family)